MAVEIMNHPKFNPESSCAVRHRKALHGFDSSQGFFMEDVGMPKRCSTCDIEKSFDFFHKKAKSEDGYRSECKECRKIETQEYYEKNRERIILETTEYNRNHPEQRRIICKKYAEANKEKEILRHRKYYQENKKKCKEYTRKYKNARYQRDIKFRLNACISGSMRRELSSNKDGIHWEFLVGYSVDSLKEHLEKQFKDGMNWNNHGKKRGMWHIDHKIPISVFNFTAIDHIDFKRCWALSNLQPMWGDENIKKRNNLEEPFQPFLAFGGG